MAGVSHLAPIHLGLDVHKDTISVGVLEPDQQIPDVERITHDEVSVRRLVGRFDDPRTLRACYEAGPTGFELARLLHSMDVRCEVIAPSLIPRHPATRSRPTGGTAGGWPGCTAPASWSVSVSPPWPRRPCEICAAPEPTWSKTSPAPATGWASSCCATGGHGGAGRPDPRLPGVAALPAVRPAGHDPDVRALPGGRGGPQHPAGRREADLVGWCGRPPFDWQVARLAAYRGVTRLGALTLAAEVADWRRFAHASQFMGFCGLVPSEYASGNRVHRGQLTKAGNAHLRAQLAWVGLVLPASTRRRRRDRPPPTRPAP